MRLRATSLLARENSETFEVSNLTPRSFVDLLDGHKAPLFQAAEDQQSFSVEDFGSFLVSLDLEYYPYIGGAAPLTIIPVKASTQDIVFTANESPPKGKPFDCACKSRT